MEDRVPPKIHAGLRAIGIAGAALCIVGVVLNRQQFFVSYLFAFMFWFGIAIGCLGLLLLHSLTGGAWGDVIRPLLAAGATTLPGVAVLFIPLLLGLSVLYPWVHPAGDALLEHKHLFLNVPFFCLRVVVYFAAWSWMARRLGVWTAQSLSGDQTAAERAAQRSAPWLVIYIFTLTFACIDWMMSLEPHWYSTIYALVVLIGQGLSALAFVICALVFVRSPQKLLEENPVKPFWDLGNIVLTFVMFWAYLAFSQYLIIWSTNLPEEISWYLHRQQAGWFWIAMSLVIFQFVLPFAALLGRHNKQNIGRLAWVAALLLAIHVVEVFWLVEPPFYPLGFHIHWLDLVALMSVGAVWVTCFLTQLGKLPSPLAIYRPEVES